jgi:hypothetical protein
MIWLIAFLLAAPTPKWQRDWKTAFQMAKAEHRLVAVRYTQTEARCKRCWELENVILTNPDVQRRISDFVLLHVDPDISAIPRAHRYATPAFVIFDWDERERFRIDGEHVLRVDDWHEHLDLKSNENYPLYGPLERFRSEERAFVKAAELLDEQKDAEAYQLLAEAYDRLHMTAHARAARARLAP